MGMIVLAVRYTVQPGQAAAVLDGLRRMAALVKANEPGCLVYQVCRSTADEHQLLLIEHYRDQAALDAHGQTPYFREILLDQVVPLLADRVRETYELVIDAASA